MADQDKKQNLDLLEEDDEFEEFPTEDWRREEEEEEEENDKKIWEDNWDDDNVEDDFSQQLRQELLNQGHKVESMQQ